MTEAEWLGATDPRYILNKPGWRNSRHNIQGAETCHPLVTGDRRLRLYACGCLRLAFPHLIYAVDRHALEAAERFADGLVTAGEMALAGQRCGLVASNVTRNPAENIARNAVSLQQVRADHPAGPQHPLLDQTRCDLLRCIFGNPFRPVTFSPFWLTETVTTLAAGIYANRAFDRLPILADALQEAGCEDEQVLSHCRGNGPHARGCWVVDGVLGKG